MHRKREKYHEEAQKERKLPLWKASLSTPLCQVLGSSSMWMVECRRTGRSWDQSSEKDPWEAYHACVRAGTRTPTDDRWRCIVDTVGAYRDSE